jgi:aspartyl-tRNA(Asn)/glutamyl-tRNA(Gln) amidotransferase subunit A
MATRNSTLDLNGRSVLSLAAMIQSGAADPVAIAEATLDAIEAGNEAGLFLQVTRARALAEAEAASRRIRTGRARGVLDGVPVAWKDLFDLEGMVTTAGSKVLAKQPVAKADAPVVRRLRDAGMVSVGRVGMTEFAFSGLGLNPHYGTPRNPHGRDVPRIPGGSSSGAAVAVAKGLVPVAIGTDTGGSVRIPAAFNGIVGYKGTHSRYPMQGVFPLAQSLDSLGPLCRTVADAVAVDAAMRGLVASDITRRTLDGVRLIVPTNVVFDEAEAAVIERVEAAIARLEAEGIIIERRAIPAFNAVLDLGARHGALATAEAYALHAARVGGPDAAEMDPMVANRVRGGAKITAADLIAIQTARTQLIAEARRGLGADTFIAYPAIAHVAPPIAPLEKDDALYLKTNLLTLRNTMLGNFLNWCGISLPCGTDAQGMPIGFLLSGAGGDDEALLSLALAIEDSVRG